MKEIIVSGYGIGIRIKNGLLQIRESKQKKFEVSPSDIDVLVIATGGISLTSNALRTLLRHGVDVIFLDPRGKPIGRLYPPFINRTVFTRRRQYEAYYGEEKWRIITNIIEAKIRNQSNLLKYYSRTRSFEELREIAYDVIKTIDKLPLAIGDRGKIMAVEAEAARAYWNGMTLLFSKELEFRGRDPESFDPVNMCLNYVYALLYGVCWRVLVLAGLDPYAGFLHSDRSGKESLVYDYSEMFKPSSVDRLIVKLFSEGWRPEIENGLITSKSRGQLIKAFFQWLDRRVRPTSGSPCTLQQAIKRWAFMLASYLRGDLKKYRGFVEPW